MTDNSFETTVTSLVKGMDSFLTSKTVVGDPIQIGETIILPLVDVSFGIGAGSFTGEKKRNCGPKTRKGNWFTLSSMIRNMKRQKELYPLLISSPCEG